jgi:DNA-binding NarL/FixJ family response regulator
LHFNGQLGASIISTVFVIDWHSLIRTGVQAALADEQGLKFIGGAATARDGIAAITEKLPDVVVTEMMLPDGIASQIIQRGRAVSAKTRFVVLTGYEAGTKNVMYLLRSGASGFVLKSSPVSEAVSAIRSVSYGGVYVDSNVNRMLLEQTRQLPRNRSTLEARDPTPREDEVLRLTALGHADKAIAEMLRLSVKTIGTHKRRAMKKLQLGGRAGLIAYAVQRGWFPPGVEASP